MQIFKVLLIIIIFFNCSSQGVREKRQRRMRKVFLAPSQVGEPWAPPGKPQPQQSGAIPDLSKNIFPAGNTTPRALLYSSVSSC